jgi:hypothetical protein
MAAAESGGPNPALMIADSMVKPRSVSRLWRTASLGLAAAVLALGITTFQLRAKFVDLTSMLHTDQLIASVTSEFGSTFAHDVLFGRDTQRVVLTAAASGAHAGEASVFLNPEWKEALFFCRAMQSAPGRTLKIAVVDDNDRVLRDLATFESSGELKLVRVPLTTAQHGRVAVVTTGGSGPEFNKILVKGELAGPSL